MDAWLTERDEWTARHPQPHNSETEAEYHRLFSTKLEEWMDQGMGSCLLRDPRFSAIVAENLLYFSGERFLVDSFVVMPNHVHVLAQLLPGSPLEKVVQSWKQRSARKINELREETGNLWAKRYWDRLVRSEEHFWKIRRYILCNPTKANLPEGEYLLYTPWH